MYTLHVLLLVLPTVFCSVEDSFRNIKLVPDVLKSPPKSELFLHFGNAKVNLGNRLTPRQVKPHPIVSWPAEESSYYALTFSDPDAPSAAKPSYREFLHWLVGNIPGTDLSKATTLAPYWSSAPGNGTGDHRYCMLVFKQPGVIKFGEEPRAHFSAQKFAEKHGMDPVPVAGNFYLAQWDDSVPPQ